MLEELLNAVWNYLNISVLLTVQGTEASDQLKLIQDLLESYDGKAKV